jgi:hypothetical protein
MVDRIIGTAPQGHSTRCANPLFATPDESSSTYRCVMAKLGGRFQTLAQALAHEDFRKASPPLARKLLAKLAADKATVADAKEREECRRQDEIEAFVSGTKVDSTNCRKDLVWLEEQFDRLVIHASRAALFMDSAELNTFRWIFELADLEDRRYWSFQFQLKVYRDLIRITEGALVLGGKRLFDVAAHIFGSDGAYSIRSIKNAVRDGKEEPGFVGRPTHFPREPEAVLFRFISKLRSLKCPVFKSWVIDYGMCCLEGTEASLNFAMTDANGDYVPSEHGGFKWDMDKLDSWFYRRFIGDRKEEGACTGNQHILDMNRAKWHSFEAMQPYFRMQVETYVEEGICYYNENDDYDEDDKDSDGIPKQPVAFWIESERWRAMSFDETRLDDETHGAGADRQGRTERIIRCGKWDDGETIGQKCASHTASMVGGSNALGEPLPPWFVLASKTCDDSMFALGPVAIINGKSFPSRGTCNVKGSVNSENALRLIDECFVPAFEAHGKLSDDRRGVISCDGVGPHMTTQFLDKCTAKHILVCLRTMWCSNSIQFEDLLNFWIFKNAKEIGWYRVKQTALASERDATAGWSTGLTHAKQIQLLVPAWDQAFSKATNQKAWDMGGFGAAGITMAPLWKQREKDLGVSVEDRARSKMERRRDAVSKLGLNQTYHFDSLTAPWQRSMKQLNQDEADRALAEEERADDADAGPQHASTHRFSAEQQYLQCPANSKPGKKLRSFHDEIVTLKTSKAPRLIELLETQCPGVVCRRNEQRIVHLARKLQEMYNAEPMINYGRTVNFKFNAREKLNKKLQEEWDSIFGEPEGKTAEDSQKDQSESEKTKEVPKPFGYGAG